MRHDAMLPRLVEDIGFDTDLNRQNPGNVIKVGDM